MTSYDDLSVNLVFPPACKVTLVSATEAPMYLLSQVNRIYQGFVDLAPESEEDIAAAVKELQVAVLQTPLEMVHYLFLINDVSRAFTHQIVRYRVGVSFAQESLRFADARRSKVLMPHILRDHPEEQRIYREAAERAIRKYAELVDRGVPTQDARGILPTNLLTHLYFDCSHKSLMAIYRQRMTGLAQPGEWEHVLRGCKEAIAERFPVLAATLMSSVEAKSIEVQKDKWVADMLAILHPKMSMS